MTTAGPLSYPSRRAVSSPRRPSCTTCCFTSASGHSPTLPQASKSTKSVATRWPEGGFQPQRRQHRPRSGQQPPQETGRVFRHGRQGRTYADYGSERGVRAPLRAECSRRDTCCRPGEISLDSPSLGFHGLAGDLLPVPGGTTLPGAPQCPPGHHTANSPHDPFWSRVFGGGQPAAAVVADTCLAMLQDILHTDISVADHTGPNVQAVAIGPRQVRLT